MGRPDRPFSRVLVANRGEIAVRIIRACSELGVESVAVYSDADVGALHVREADRAVRIGGASPADSYLRGERIVDAALATGAEAVHPGYGFLAERASFAGAVESAGLAFIGPPSDVIDALGDKLHARRIARDAGVSVVPGTLEPAVVDDAAAMEGLRETASSIGFPVLVKAAAGGGGRGMRNVETPDDLARAVSAASEEARAAFGDGAVYLEKAIERARHVEVQLLGDAAGDVIAVGERDCSLQRRHQKLVEEAPAPGLTQAERRRLHAMAVGLATAARLQNAATAEFLLTPDRSFFFLEVNTRLQVEHGITELVAGLDLVHEQLWLAAGQPLSAAARSAAATAASPTRHAIEARITAEDPGHAFAPAPGRIRHWVMPGGPGVRVDSGVEAGRLVPAEYDNLVAKVMVVAADRDAALRRLRRALDETEIAGIQTTLPFHRFVARSPAFRPEALSIRWVDEHWDGEAAWRAAAEGALMAAGLAAVSASDEAGVGGSGEPLIGQPAALLAGRSGAGRPEATPSRWREAGLAEAVDRWPT